MDSSTLPDIYPLRGETFFDFFLNSRKSYFDPFYVYDTKKIRENCRTFKAIPWPYKSVHFASMANIHPEFLRIVKEEGINIFVNSTGHMELAFQAGFRPDQVIFTASALSEETMELLREKGVQCNVDSPNQLAQW